MRYLDGAAVLGFELADKWPADSRTTGAGRRSLVGCRLRFNDACRNLWGLPIYESCKQTLLVTFDRGTG